MCKYSYLYSAKPFPANNFCLNVCRRGGKFHLVLFTSCLILGLFLSERNLDFINILGFYYVKNRISLIDKRKVILCPLNDIYLIIFNFQFKTYT